MKELKIVIIGYNDVFETQDEMYTPLMTRFILQSEKDIDAYHEFAMEIAEEYGYIRSVIISQNDSLFKTLNLESQFNEYTRRMNLDDFIDEEEKDEDCEFYEGDD